MTNVGRGVDLTNDDEVQEYIKNLGTEYRFGCYSEKDPKACHLLGDFMEAIKQDYEKAKKIYEINCDEYGMAHSCHKSGGYYFAGRGCPRDLQKAFEFFEKACNLTPNFPTSCLNAGLLSQLEAKTQIGGIVSDNMSCMLKSEPADHLKAINYFKKACDGEIAEGCHRYSSTMLTGIKGVVEPNLAEAHKYALKGCELGSKDSCVNTSIMYTRGDGVPKNERLGRRYANIARDMMKQETETRERTKFQEGVETVGGQPVSQ